MEEKASTSRSEKQPRTEVENLSLQLLKGIADLQDTLALVAQENTDLGDGEKASIDYAAQALVSFDDSEPTLIHSGPRSIRDDDRRKILPGQHGGVFLQYSIQDGTILRLNFYGGLRTIDTSDNRDTSIHPKSHHTARTDQIASQNTELNWQIIFTDGFSIDSWISHNPNRKSFMQSALIQTEKNQPSKIDCNPNINSNDSRYEDLLGSIKKPINKLISLIPSGV